MGWASANSIFDSVADKMVELQISDDVKTKVLSVLISELQSRDWDTEGESLGEYQDDPAIVAAFRQNDIFITCDTENEQSGEWCESERGHTDDHKSWGGLSWPQ